MHKLIGALAASGIAIVALSGSAHADTSICNKQFPGNPPPSMIKFCLGLNVGIGEAEISIVDMRADVAIGPQDCKVYSIDPLMPAQVGDPPTFGSPVNDTTGKRCEKPPPRGQVGGIDEPTYLDSKRAAIFFSRLNDLLTGDGSKGSGQQTDDATFRVNAYYRENAAAKEVTPIVVVGSYKKANDTYALDYMGAVCPNPISGKGSCPPPAGPQPTVLTPPPSWTSYKIMSPGTPHQWLRVVYTFDAGGGEMSPTSYYGDCVSSTAVQSARSHFYYYGDSNGNSIDICYCTDSNGDGDCGN